MTATEAQNNFGQVLERAVAEGMVTITRYDRAAAVVLSIDAYEALAGDGDAELDELTREFDAMLGRMQTAAATTAVDALFELDASSLGEAAVRGARGSRRGRRRTGG